jgi:hypothetical protein
MGELAGRVAVITGSGGDIGRVSTNLRWGTDAAG